MGGIIDLLTGFLGVIHNFVEGIGVTNLGWAYVIDIAIYTLILKTIFLPLYIYQQKSSLVMNKVQPLMKEIQAKYKNNPQKMQEEQMKLYKELGANPLKGCLPALVQMPIFFAMFSVISSFTGFAGTPFLWIGDLAKPDSYFVLPVVAALTQFLTMRISSMHADESQKSMMNKMGIAMGVMFLIFCINYKSALAIYFISSSIIQMVQTLVVNSYLRKKQDEKDAIKKAKEEERLAKEAAERATRREEYKKTKKKKSNKSGEEVTATKKSGTKKVKEGSSEVDPDRPRKKKKKRTDESLKPKSQSKDDKVVE